MPFCSSWIKALFIIMLAFPLYSESFFQRSFRRHPPNCDLYADQLHLCTRQMDPICATNRQTYSNKCVFCSEMMESGQAFQFDFYGRC
ncbi:sperm-associated acrosin inhibitor-like [Elephas maximus indicus]|uniref:sperm-associated acrosin inhibitor-like n=1 Tax=Elephas maximus indicus TaxID=99487 RepID=UPI0021162824|nr:sperm-associated acrosin inhibitor-like [Elephas maximus indicus]XP_049714541.1 sperm-associated acrosin inhibitor-like [Elephas maximus indicus]